MVPLPTVLTSNALIPTALPEGLIAVFVGGTSGIGEYTLKAFAKRAVNPRIVNIGRNEEAARKIEGECRSLNEGLQYEFIKADTSLLSTVDAISKDLTHRLPHINVLFLTTGMLGGGPITSENLHLPASLLHHSRLRFTLNLLPLIRRAPNLRRVVSVLAAGKEGPLICRDIQGRDVPMRKLSKFRGHGASLVTFGLERVAESAPGVTFIHAFPGPVKTNIGRGGQGFAIGLIAGVFDTFVMPFVSIPADECGERHLYLCTSGKFPAAEGAEVKGIPLEGNDGGQSEKSGDKKDVEVQIARDTMGVQGGGMYSVDEKCEDTGPEVVKLLEGLRKDGTKEHIWAQTVEEFERIRGGMSIVAEAEGMPTVESTGQYD